VSVKTLILVLLGSAVLSAQLPSAARAGEVSAALEESLCTLDNGVIRARVSRESGDLLSLVFRGQEMLHTAGGRAGGYWSHNTARGRHASHLTIDPKTNSGARAELSVQGFSDGTPLGSGPGGSFVADIEIRYTLGKDDSGLYTYSILHHAAAYPASSLGEARFCAKLNDGLFDWMTVDARRNMKMITADDWNHGTVMNMKEARRMNTGLYQGQVEHKYDYSANQFDVRAWGWVSTTAHTGLWFVNPSVEYLSGGPTKVELSAHRDATFTDSLTAPAPPTLLNYWRGSHYGGSVCSVARGEDWAKVVGPFLIYCNSGGDQASLWKDALAKADTEGRAWPFDWAAETDYPRRSERATISGRLVLEDPQAPGFKFRRWLVGATAPDDEPPGGGASRRGASDGWQTDAKHYQFWVRGAADGSFAIPQVRPGRYSLHAIADGVLGEFVATNLVVAPGLNLDLGTLAWHPVRHGREIWQIGIPDRSAAEFFKGDDYCHWGWYLEYPKLFPRDVRYVVGRSDFRKDWFFEQVPHNEDPANTTGKGNGRATTWRVEFEMPAPSRGQATLRLGLCALETRSLAVAVNGQPAGAVTDGPRNSTINRDGITGRWMERDVVFDAALLKAGTNVLELTVPSGSLTSGVMYDCLRLELAEEK